MTYQIYLNSASSTDIYPENTNSSFRVQLPRSIDTKGYKCALSEICFTSDILSLPSDNSLSVSSTKVMEEKAVEISFHADSGLESRIKQAFAEYGPLEYFKDRYQVTLPNNVNVEGCSKFNRLIGTVVNKITTGNYTVHEFSPTQRLTELSDHELYTLMYYKYGNNYHAKAGALPWRTMSITKSKSFKTFLDELADTVNTNKQRFVYFTNGVFHANPNIELLTMSAELRSVLGFQLDVNARIVEKSFNSTDTVKFNTMEKIQVSYSLPSIKYTSEKHVFDTLTEALKDSTQCVPEFNSLTSKITLKLSPDTLVKLTESLSYFLGFGGSLSLTETTEARTPISINYRCNTLFVNCSIVSHSIVSHVYNRILRVIPLEQTVNSSMIYRSYVDQQFFSVDQDTVDSVHVSLLTEYGERLHLNDSNLASWITLTFKKDDYD
jgi:hypothetical protein